jgi:predicted DCC family thiol-disulfide oxidoreductase YuxK
VARTLGGLWKLALIFKPLPRALRDPLYFFIARHRYRWFGQEETCMMPTAALKARMVE